jgi:hypothetical protein
MVVSLMKNFDQTFLMATRQFIRGSQVSTEIRTERQATLTLRVRVSNDYRQSYPPEQTQVNPIFATGRASAEIRN